MIKLLIVDDEIKIREVVKEYARVNGFECLEASNGKEAVDLAFNNDFDCIILDIMMPELDGFSACKKIKKYKNVPIIMLSARQDEEDKLLCFEMGVDDYVTKPFSPKELMARIKAILLRNKKSENEKFIYKGLEVDIDGHNVLIDGTKANMTPKEYDLLFYLIENKNVAVSREQILNAVWKIYTYYGDDRTVDTHIKMLRKSLGPYRNLIYTVRGMGYKLEV